MKIAIVHDWFNEAGGAEKVCREILHCFPEADIYCLFDFFEIVRRERLNHNRLRIGTGDIRHLLDWRLRAVIVHANGIEHGGRGPTGAEALQFIAKHIERLLHASLGVFECGGVHSEDRKYEE